MELKEINRIRKLKGVSWNDLASVLPIKGDSLRIQFSRNNVDEAYLGAIKEYLGINAQKPSKPSQVKEAQSDYGSIKNEDIIKVLMEFHKQSMDKLNNIEQLGTHTALNVQEILASSKVSSKSITDIFKIVANSSGASST